MASACRDAKFCVSRAMWRVGCLCFIPCISCASLLVRRKILRLTSNVTGWLSVCYAVCILRIFACETQDFASLLCWFATGKYGFLQIITMALACRDAKFCVSRTTWRAGCRCFILTVKNIDNVPLTGSLFSITVCSVLKNACFRTFVYIVECQWIMFFATRCEHFRFVKEAFLYVGKGSLAV